MYFKPETSNETKIPKYLDYKAYAIIFNDRLDSATQKLLSSEWIIFTMHFTVNNLYFVKKNVEIYFETKIRPHHINLKIPRNKLI